ncbi:MAG: hypothetical protein JWN86_2859 [Planctomycetota bacterium]|nr:hypothetical protein [Planctomycetota bacterium]
MSRHAFRSIRRNPKPDCRSSRPSLEMVEPRILLSVFTVTRSDDGAASGGLTLRQAIQAANVNPGLDTINFAITGSGVQTITPATALDDITGPVVIDGYTQAGSSRNTLPNGDNAVLQIELDGTSAGTGIAGLRVVSGSSTITGLAINRFGGPGISLDTGGGNLIQGNFLGTDPTGTIALPNGQGGVGGIASSNNTIGGTNPADRNVISGNGAAGVSFTIISGSGVISSGNLILGNFLGIDAGGTNPLGNTGPGISLTDVTGNTVGGMTPGARNIISSNSTGVLISTNTGAPVANDVVLGNYIGTDVSGKQGLGNAFDGILLSGASGNTIGGVAAGAGNVLADNQQFGIQVGGAGASKNVIQGNLIGTDVTGNTALANASSGVDINTGASGNLVGGTTTGSGNVISGNQVDGVTIENASPSNIVQGNFIGTDLTGSSKLGNGGVGVQIRTSANNTVGGTTPGAANTIAFSIGAGVVVVGTSASAAGNAILSNSIHDNGGLGIDLGNDGVTPNTPGGPHAGPNNLQNFPIITRIVHQPNSSIISGTFNSTPGTQFTLQFFSNVAADSSGFGEGQTFLGQATTTTDTAGNATFSFTTTSPVAPNQPYITSTATDAAGNTSEFSKAALSTIVTNTKDSGLGSLRQAILNANSQVGHDTIQFEVGPGVQTIQPLTALPVVQEEVTIDATAPSDLPTQSVVIDGTNAPGTSGFTFADNNNVVRGLSVVRFHSVTNPSSGAVNGGIGIVFQGSNNLAAGNFLGTDPAGDVNFGNDQDGILIQGGQNTIGGITQADRNVISGNKAVGILVATSEAPNNLIEGNFIGIDPTGAVALPNGIGILVDLGSSNTTIGGSKGLAGNVISGNAGDGISIVNGQNTLILGNIIGSGPSFPRLDADLGNGGAGVRVGVNATGTQIVQGNSIVHNRGAGVRGDFQIGQPTIVAFASILGNSIFNNGALGIDMYLPGVTPNRPVGPTVGPDLLPNFPVIQSVTPIPASPGLSNAHGIIDELPNTTYHLEFFQNDVADPSGNGQGQLFLGAVDVLTDSGGHAQFDAAVAVDLSTTRFVTATATSPDQRTSEFSADFTVIPTLVDLGISLTAAPEPVFVDGDLTYTITLANKSRTTATGVVVTDTLPAGVDYVSSDSPFSTVFTPAHVNSGSIIPATVTFTIPTLAPNSSVVIHILARPSTDGTFTDTVSFTANQTDVTPSDNSASVTSHAVFNFIVRNTDDNGFGSLRSVIVNAYRHAGPETITFALPVGSPLTIAPRTPLPPILGPTTLDATTQAGFDGVPIVTLTGASMTPSDAGYVTEPGAGRNGLNLGSGVTIRGLQILNFPGSGIAILGGSNDVIAGNIINDNAENGVLIRAIGNQDQPGNQARFNRIGGTGPMDGNLISHNDFVGIQLSQHATGTLIQGNLIGSDITGENADGNGLDGLFLDNALDTTIGGTAAGARNLISNSGEVDIQVFGSDATRNVIQGNLIGTNLAGTKALIGTGSRLNQPTAIGVWINGAPGNLVGGDTPAASNLISGNDAGVEILGPQATRNRVAGNRIGTDLSGTSSLGNQFGVFLSGSPGNTIGGLTPGERNVISGNTILGIRVSDPSARANLIVGNYIGVDASGLNPLGNTTNGIIIDRSPANTVGGSTPGAGNVVSGNLSVDIQVSGTAASENVIAGNMVGTTATGGFLDSSRKSPNRSLVGILVSESPRNTVGGLAAGAGNLVADHRQAGIEILGKLADNNLVAGNTVRDNDNYGIIANDRAGNSIPLTGQGANILQNNPRNFLPVSNVPAQVVNVTATSDGTTIQSVVVTFSRILDPVRATNVKNYRIDVLNVRGRRTGTVKISAASYDDQSMAVTLTPASPLPVGGRYRLTITGRGRNAVTDDQGHLIDGDKNSRPGGNFVGPIVVSTNGLFVSSRAAQTRHSTHVAAKRPWHTSKWHHRGGR